MNHSEYAVQKLRGNHRAADISSDTSAFFNITTLAAAMATTRARVEGLIARGEIKIRHCSSDGQALFPVSELPTCTAAYHRRLL